MDTAYHVPCCPRCAIPLRPDETDDRHGACPSLHCPAKGEVFTEESWTWLHQDTFDYRDLPPFNGWEPIRVDA